MFHVPDFIDGREERMVTLSCVSTRGAIRFMQTPLTESGLIHMKGGLS